MARPGECAVTGGQQPIALVVERHGPDLAERLVVEIADAGIDLEVLEQVQDFDRGARQDREADARDAWPGTASSGARRSAARSGSRRCAGGPDEAALQGIEVLPHRLGVADDAARPVEHPLALGREALEPGASAGRSARRAHSPATSARPTASAASRRRPPRRGRNAVPAPAPARIRACRSTRHTIHPGAVEIVRTSPSDISPVTRQTETNTGILRANLPHSMASMARVVQPALIFRRRPAFLIRVPRA